MLLRESMSDKVQRVLLERIADGTYSPGHRLVELQIAQELGTSQAPVREALCELETLGFIEVKAYCGTHVREVTEKEMSDAYRVRAILEELAGTRAAKHFRDNVGELRAHIEAALAAAEQSDIETYVRHDLPFHRAILEASGNEVLLRTWDSLGFSVRTRMFLTRCPDHLLTGAKSHFPIVDALEKGDGVLAGRLLRQHSESFAVSE